MLSRVRAERSAVLCNLVLDSERKVSASSEPHQNGLMTSSVNAPDSSVHSVNTAPILERMERLLQAVTILQLERPSDWLSFRYHYDDGKESSEKNSESLGGNPTRRFLTREEVKKIMNLRVDFTEDAVEKACVC